MVVRSVGVYGCGWSPEQGWGPDEAVRGFFGKEDVEVRGLV
jgi:hypothetical protein